MSVRHGFDGVRLQIEGEPTPAHAPALADALAAAARRLQLRRSAGA